MVDEARILVIEAIEIPLPHKVVSGFLSYQFRLLTVEEHQSEPVPE